MAERLENLTPEEEKHVERVMNLFNRRRLRSSDGETVTDRSKALAIAYSEVRAKRAHGGFEERTWKGRKRLRPKKA